MSNIICLPQAELYRGPSIEVVQNLDDLKDKASKFLKFLIHDLRSKGKELKDYIHEVGFLPDEGETLLLDLALSASNVSSFQTNTDRIADLELGLFTNVAPADTIAESGITEPTGTGYARITLTDATWTLANPSTYTLQTFTAGSGGWTGSVQGYFISTFLGGTGTKRLLAIEVDGSGPYTFNDGDTYDITPSVSAD